MANVTTTRAQPRAHEPSPLAVRESVVRIEVAETVAEGQVAAAHLDHPAVGPAGGYRVSVSGWAVGSGPGLATVELRCQGVVVGGLDAADRDDVREVHPTQDWVRGFTGTLGIPTLPASFDVELIGVLGDGSRVRLGVVAGRWDPAVDVPEDSLRPLMVTSLGRTGSTWLTRLLGQHPRISAYEPFDSEPRSASYWLAMYQALTAPRSYRQILLGELDGPEWWVGTHRSPPPPRRKNPVEDWLAVRHVESLLPFALARIEEFARATAELEGKADSATLFCEKFGVGSFAQPFLTSLVPGAREILLVRDPRDMICSMLAYNRKRSVDGFGRDQVSSDAEFIHWWRGGVEKSLAEWQGRSDAAMRLKYEDLILEPLATLERIFAHVGVESDDDTVEAVLDRAVRGRRDVQKRHQTAPDPTSSIGRWREEFTPELAAAADESLADLVEAFGYAR